MITFSTLPHHMWVNQIPEWWSWSIWIDVQLLPFLVVEYWICFKWNKHRCTYVQIVEFILVELHASYCTRMNWFTLENTLAFIQLQQWMRNVRITLRSYWQPINWIELQLHEKVPIGRTNLWDANYLFASCLAPYSVNWNPCWLLITQTIKETLECHSCS